MEIHDIVISSFNNDGDNIVLNIAEAAIELGKPLPFIEENVLPQERDGVKRNQKYFEEIIPQYTQQQFREHFKMSKNTYDALLNQIRKVHGNAQEYIPLGKKLLATIWLLSKQDSFLSSGNRFGFAQSTLFKIFNDIIDDLCQLASDLIVWPNHESLQKSAEVFEKLSQGIPGVIGVIDCCHIAIHQPVGHAFDYYNTKGFHSVIMQGICNEHGVFIDISVGSSGRMDDSKVFCSSPIYKCLTTEDKFLSPLYHLIGDSGYPLLPSLMKPYLGYLTREQQIYNTKLSLARSVIARAFGLLKSKWRRLQLLEVHQPETAAKIILACCVLHNFLLTQNNPEDDYQLEENKPEDDITPVFENDEAVTEQAEQKRMYIVSSCQ